MKYTLFIAIGLAACLIFYSCSKDAFKNPPTKHVTVLFDDTDPLAARPTSSDIVSLFNFRNEDAYLGYDFRLRRLSSISLTDIFEQYLPSQNKLTGSEMQRIAQVKSFRKAITAKLDSLNREKITEQDYSVLFRTISEELNHLAELPPGEGTRICLIFSDMEEHSQDANFVSKSGFEEVKNNPNAVIERLEKVAPLKDLTGIEIRIVFKPSSHAQELKFDADMNVFKSIFQQHHATVTVSADALNQ